MAIGGEGGRGSERLDDDVQSKTDDVKRTSNKSRDDDRGSRHRLIESYGVISLDEFLYRTRVNG